MYYIDYINGHKTQQKCICNSNLNGKFVECVIGVRVYSALL